MHHNTSLLTDPRFWVAAAFTIFFLIFGKKIVTLLTGMLDKRSAGIQAELDGAARLRREAEALLVEARQQRELALREAETTLANARTEAARVAEAARAEAGVAAERRERMAMERIAAAEKAAVTEVRLAAADVASRAAGQVIAEGFGADADAQLIDHAIQGLPAALAERRAA